MIKRTCKQCGKNFTITDSEVQFYKSKGLELPKRCSECRKKNNNNINNNLNDDIEKTKENENYKSTKHKINKNTNVFKSIVASLLVVLVLVISRVFSIDISGLWQDANYTNEQSASSLQFRNERLLDDHFIKHGSEFGYSTKEEYLEGANKVINSPSSLHKQEGEDGDDIYYDEKSNEIVFVSEDGYIRTYFKPSEGINYYNRQ